ncbi:S41 family peptidase, partial [Planctomycetota bacterium]
LQDHGRAILVGEKTFGKGSVQQLLKVKATTGKSTLRLTIAKYYLPSGRSIHRDAKSGEGGVGPDVVVEQETRTSWQMEESDKLLGTGAVEKYVDSIWKADKDLAKEMARFDDHSHSRYPGFDKWHEDTGTPLSQEHARALVRQQLRRLAQDDAGREFPTDLQEDRQLQRAVYEALRKADLDPQDYAEYRGFQKKFAEAPTDEPSDEEGEVH